MKGPARSLVLYGALGVAGLLLILIAVQQDALEKRLIEQTKATSALSDKTQRIAEQLDRIQKEGVASTGAVSTNAEYVDPLAKILHPEVPNFLGKDDVQLPPPNAKPGGTYTRGWPFGDPKTLNWVLSNAAEVSELVIAYCDGALAGRNTYGDPDKWHGDLAWRVEVTDDFKEYTIYLRRDVKWHSPSGVDLDSPKYAWLKKDHPLTAHDFVFAFDMVLNPQVENGSLKNYYADLESWKAVDDYTLVVRWKKKQFQALELTIGVQPLPEFIFAFNEDGSRIPKATIGLKFNQHWYNNRGYVGTGPYRFATYQSGVKIVLERYDGYHGTKPPIEKIIYPIYTDQNQSVLKLRAGELTAERLLRSHYKREVLELLKMPEAQRPKDNPFVNGDIQCDIINLPSYRYLGWNTLRPPFDDVEVRKAMAYAFNRTGIIKEVFIDMGEVPRGPFLPGSKGHDPQIEPLPFDLKKAGDILTAAGWVDSDDDGLRDKMVGGRLKSFEFSLLVGSIPEYASLGTIFKEDLLKIGVKLNLEVSEWSLFQKRTHEKDFDAFFAGWILNWTEDAYQFWHSSQADVAEGSNYTSFKNPEADQLIVKLRETFDTDERIKVLRRLHRLITDSYNYTLVITEKRPFCYQRSLKGVIYSKIRPLEFSAPWWLETQ